MKEVKENQIFLSESSKASLSISLTLEKFRKFMKSIYKSRDFPKYDYAIAFTK